MFTAAAFVTVVETWKQSQCPSTSESLGFWYIQTMEHHSATKRNKLLIQAAVSTDLEVLFSENCQS